MSRILCLDAVNTDVQLNCQINFVKGFKDDWQP